MSIILELPADIEANLRAEADAQGWDASALVLDLISERFAVVVNLPPLGTVSDYPSREAYIATTVARADVYGVDPDLIASLAEGIADADQGKFYTLDEVRNNVELTLAAQ